MEQILSIPFEGPLQAELHEEAAQNAGKTIFVARSVASLMRHLRDAEESPELMIVDSTWTPGLLVALNASAQQKAIRDVPTILTKFEPADPEPQLMPTFNVIAKIDLRDQFTDRLPQLLTSFFQLKSSLRRGTRITSRLYRPLVKEVLEAPVRDKHFFGRALIRQDEKDAQRLAHK